MRNNATASLDNDVTFASVEGSGAFSIPDTLTLTTGDNGNNTISGTLSGNGTLVSKEMEPLRYLEQTHHLREL